MTTRYLVYGLIAGAIGGVLLGKLGNPKGPDIRPQSIMARDADNDRIAEQLSHLAAIIESHSEHLVRAERMTEFFESGRARTPVVTESDMDLTSTLHRLESMEKTIVDLAGVIDQIAKGLEDVGGFDRLPEPGLIAGARETDCAVVRSFCAESFTNREALRSRWLGRSHAEVMEALGKPSWIDGKGKWYWECSEANASGRVILTVSFRSGQCTSISGGL